MAEKLYTVGLVAALQVARKYIARNQTRLQASVTTEQFTCIQSTLVAIVACLALFPKPTKSP